MIAPGSKVVDVGGGMGHIVMSVGKKYPELVAVVEDRPAVVEQAKDVRRMLFLAYRVRLLTSFSFGASSFPTLV